MKAILMLSALLSLSTISASGDAPFKIAVWPLISFAPSNLTVRMGVARDRENRALDVVIESSDFYRSSQIPLEGDQAPATFQIQFRDLPKGNYEVSGLLTDSAGHQRAIARQRVKIIPSGGQ